MRKIKVTSRNKVRRLSNRSSYERENINSILDDSFICYLGFVVDDQPFVIPTAFGRKDDKIFFHGSVGSRMVHHLKTGPEICVTVSIVDGIVLARSAFHHSINYRSVVIFGKAEEITESKEKENALRIISEQIIHGRWNDVRKPDQKELEVTSVFSLSIDEASAKTREGDPKDDKEDLDLNIWAGVLPLKLHKGIPINAADLKENISVPDYIKNYTINNNQ